MKASFDFFKLEFVFLTFDRKFCYG